MFDTVTIYVILIPIGLYGLFLVGRVVGAGIAKSFYEEKERRNEKKDN